MSNSGLWALLVQAEAKLVWAHIKRFTVPFRGRFIFYFLNKYQCCPSLKF